MAQIDKVIEHLRSDDIKMRRKAVTWLARQGDAKAVKPLSWVAKNDPEPEISALAARAIRYIKKQTTTMPIIRDTDMMTTTEMMAVDPEKGSGGFSMLNRGYEFAKVSTQELASIIEGYEVYTYQDENAENYVSREDWEQARTLVGNAYTDHVNFRQLSGLRKLGAALDLDPAVQEEEATKKAAKVLMNMPSDEGLKIMLDQPQREMFIGKIRKKGQGAYVNTSFLDAILALLGFGVLNFVGLMALLFITQSGVVTLFSRLGSTAEYDSFMRRTGTDPAAPYRSVYNLLTVDGVSQPISSLLTFAAANAVGVTIVVLIAALIMYVILAFGLRGTANVLETIMNSFMTLIYGTAAVYIIAAAVLFFLMPTSQGELTGNLMSIMAYAGPALLAIGILAIIIVQSRILGIVHDVSIGAALPLVLIIQLAFVAVYYFAYLSLPALQL